MPRVMLSRALAGFLLAMLLCGCNSRTPVMAVPAGSTVLAFGDSVTAGVGASSGEDWPTRLQAISAWQIRNAGLAGDTAEAAAARLDAELVQSNPALVIIEIGGNDFLRRRPPERVKEDIRALIQRARASGARVVLVAVPSLSLLAAVSGRLRDAALYAELAQEEKLPLVENVFSDVLSEPALRADPIHPNRLGYETLAEGIAASLVEQGILRRTP